MTELNLLEGLFSDGSDVNITAMSEPVNKLFHDWHCWKPDLTSVC
jgi:hypothetical protein